MMRAFLDIDTQIDFLFPAGALYVPGAEKIIPALAKLNRFAMERGIPLVSTTCAHAEDDPEFRDWPAHCVAGTVGQQKPSALMMGQKIVAKQSTDLFAWPEAEAILDSLGANDFVVYGVVTEICVRAAAMGLLKRGRGVTVVTDAVMAVSAQAAEAFWSEFHARGGRVAASKDILEPDSHL